MTQDRLQIRAAAEQDRDSILAVHRNAFGQAEGSVIAKLVDEMLDDASGDPTLSLVAETDVQLVGHLLMTSARIEPDPGQVSARILAPLAVVHNRQRQGIGRRLIQAALHQLTQQGVALVFVLGYPDYYRQFGFRPAGALGLQASYPIPPQNADAWMVKELTPGTINHCQGTVRCSNALDHPKYWIE
ncbi:N-acetyltransferase [Stieleria sp. TO1_6]|uniref:GNAT family N-acetyltransferase n=1 Tax=Stieleria tagensis TaxID=2956795 RepID=UPI00209AC3A8|nr:N-acetyltransferase [Stieleria tagensis]MCO8124559.1 N-acetyltransferase [Stieleria tagensis]